MALQFTDANFEELVNSGKPMVLDFWAEWCGPCRMVGPIIDELATEYEGRVTIGKMDVDNTNDVVALFGIRNIPTVLFFKDGKVVDKQVGAAPKTTFVSKIEALLLFNSAKHFAFSWGAGYSFDRISGFFHHTSDDTFRTIGCQYTASGHAGIQSVEDFLIPHLRLLIGSERIKIDQVDPIRQSTRITVSLYFMQSKEIRNLDRNIPFRLMQGLENIFPSGTDHFAVIQALDHVHIKRIKFNRIVIYFPLMHLGIQQSQEGIEPSTETYFQNDDFFPFQMV